MVYGWSRAGWSAFSKQFDQLLAHSQMRFVHPASRPIRFLHAV